MLETCINEINDYYVALESKLEKSADMVTMDFSNEFNKEIGKYSVAIQTFFTGKEDEIKFIYKSIRENSFPYNRVKCYDINSALIQYKDYFAGLVEFINKIIDLRDTDNIDPSAIQSTIAKINNRDKEFICDIICGSKNELEEMDINDAMKNVETLIDINSTFDDYKNMVSNSCNIVDKNNCTKYANEIKAGLRVFITSIACFNSKAISEVIKTYDKIHQSIQSRTPVKGVVEIPKYQMF